MSRPTGPPNMGQMRGPLSDVVFGNPRSRSLTVCLQSRCFIATWNLSTSMCSVNTVLSKHPFPFVGGSGLARRISTSRRWSVQPCVWLQGAVHMTAGHKTLRGSGPGHKPAFDDAMALVGCPDRRIDRLKETVVACVRLALDGNPRHQASALAHSFVGQAANQSCCHRTSQQARSNGLGNDGHGRAVQLSGLAEGLTRSRRVSWRDVKVGRANST